MKTKPLFYRSRPMQLLPALTAAALLGGCAKGKDPPPETPRITIAAGTFTMGTAALDPCGTSRINTGGTYVLGCDAKDQSAAIPHTVAVDAFCIDRTEVTNLQYTHCVEHDACGKPESTNAGAQGSAGFIKGYYSDTDKYGSHPVLGVSWENAQKYCEFHGGNLPTEAQWEYAASGQGAVAGDAPIWADTAVTLAVEAGECDGLVSFAPCNDDRVQPVGDSEGDVTAQGVLDMAGNAREWVRDEFDFLSYCDQDGVTEEYKLNSDGSRPLFSPNQNEVPASLVTDATCLDDGVDSTYENGCNPSFLECRGVCSRAFRGEDSGAEKRATWRSEDCRVRHLPGTNESFRLEAGGTCEADCTGRGNDAQGCTDYCGCLTGPVDSTFDDTACLQACLGEYQTCAARCTVADTRSTCMEVATGANDPVLPRPVCVARSGQKSGEPHARPAAFNTGRIANSHVVRGGSFNEDKICAGRVARRDFEAASTPLLGFRCVYTGSACP